jgi:type II secretory pathway component GspD/PulD (secretin)
MRAITTAIVALMVFVAAPSFSPLQGQPFRLYFEKTEIEDVLRAISLKTGANVICAAKESHLVSINVMVQGAEDAVRVASAAAGLLYKRIGRNYIVASGSSMRAALEPFGERDYLAVSGPAPSDVAKQLEEAMPFLTARPAGDKVMVVGDRSDIDEARKLVENIEKRFVMTEKVNTVIFLRYANSTQVAGMLKSMFPGITADALGKDDKPGGSVGLTGSRADVDAAKLILAQIDVPSSSSQPDMVYKVYEIKYSSAPILEEFLKRSDLNVTAIIGPEPYSPPRAEFRPITASNIGGSTSGSGSASGSNTGGAGAGSTSGVAGGVGQGTGQQKQIKMGKAGDDAKMIVLRGTADQIEKALALLAEVDVKPVQVMIEVKVIDASPERAEELGLKWDWNPFKFWELPAGSPNPGTGGPPNTRPPGFGQFSRVPWSFNAVISAMITSKEAKLLANPRVQVLDNDDANIFIGDTIRAIVTSSGLGFQNSQVEEFPVGIILLIRPRVNADGNLTMRVHPVVSTVTSISANGLPQTSSREAETTVLVKDGETMVIGGLIREEFTKTISEIPLLSQLPLIGELFRHRSTSKRNSEVLVFITPRIVKDDAGDQTPKSPVGGKKEGGK